MIGTSGGGRPLFEIAGVVSDARYRSLRESHPPTFYGLPAWTMNDDGIMTLHVRTYGNPRDVIGEVRGALRAIDPSVPVVEVTTLEEEVQNSLWQERLILLLTGFFSIAALILAAIGLYGALAQAVARRTKEFGIRRAVGAGTRHMIVTTGEAQVIPIVAGVAVGFALAAIVMRIAGSLLYQVQPLDWLSYVAAALAIALGALLALILPVWKAIRVDPAVALREQ